jgi:hypothetical protein
MSCLAREFPAISDTIGLDLLGLTHGMDGMTSRQESMDAKLNLILARVGER